MRIARLVLVVAAALTAAAPSGAAAAPERTARASTDTSPPRRTPPRRPGASGSIATGPAVGFDAAAFEASLNTALDGKVMGYSYALVGKGRLVAEGGGGLARNAKDGRLPMTARTPTNLGSLFKWISGTTLLHMMDSQTPGSAAGNNSLDTQLSAQMVLLFPQTWQSSVGHPGVRAVTLRRLLQHRSGLHDCGEVVNCLKSGFDAAAADKRNYDNFNFVMIGYLIPLFEQPARINNLNTMLADIPADQRDARLRDFLGPRMDQIIRDRAFAKVPEPISASCDAKNRYRVTGAFIYRSRLDRDKGVFTSRIEEGKHCIGAGGYWMSAHDLAGYVATAMSSNALLSPRARRLMYSNEIEPDDRLIWTAADSNSWARDTFGMERIAWSNGVLTYGGGQSFSAVLVRLPLDHYAVVLANSPDLGTGGLYNAAVAAFRAGVDAAR